MPRHSDAAYALASALGNLWAIHDMAEETRLFEDDGAALALWLRNGRDCERWIAVVVTGGRAESLPPSLFRDRAFFNGQGWCIPDLAKRN